LGFHLKANKMNQIKKGEPTGAHAVGEGLFSSETKKKRDWTPEKGLGRNPLEKEKL